MKFLFHVSHPGHVHLFKHVFEKLKSQDNEIIITAIDKEITRYLLDTYGFTYHLVGKHKKGILNKILNMFKVNRRIYQISKDSKPDAMIGVAGINISQVGRLLDVKSIVLDDTEHSTFEIFLYRYFASSIFTPESFRKNLGKKQSRYRGFHELAYLHPDYFTPDPTIKDLLGVKENEEYIILRLVSWDAVHDQVLLNPNENNRRTVISELSRKYKLFLTSEEKLDDELEEFRIKIPPERIHDALYYSSLFIGEGATMCVESSFLGVPSIFVYPNKELGNVAEVSKYGLLNQVEKWSDLINLELIDEQLSLSKKYCDDKSRFLISEKVDVTKYLTENIVQMVKGKV